MNRHLRNLLDHIGSLEALLILAAALTAGRLVVRTTTAGAGPLAEDALLMSAAGAVVLIVLLKVLIGAARWVLKRGGGMLGAAGAVLEEALRMKLAMVFIVGLLISLPVLPLLLGTDDPLRYRVQSFLSYSFAATSFMLSMMTIFLGCSSLAAEIRDKQIFTLATKPISRGKFLIGKWLGIVALNAILLTVSAVAIYGFCVVILANQPAKDDYDAAALTEEVLVARVAASPSVPEELKASIEEQFKRMAEQNPELIDKAGGEAAAKLELANQALSAWRSIGPLGQQRYVFDQLKPVAQRWQSQVTQWKEATQRAKAAGVPGEAGPVPPRPEFVQLRYNTNTSRTMADDRIDVLMAINGRVQPLRMLVGTAQTIPIPVEFISPDGVLEVAFRNPRAEHPTITFKAGDGLQVLYRADDFAPNFWRAIAAVGIKLSFLAMLGLVAATFLGFPVACLWSLLIYTAASVSPFLMDAASSFRPSSKQTNELIILLYQVIGFLAGGIGTLLQKFGTVSPGAAVTEGLLFSWSELAMCGLWVGVVWTGLAAAGGVVIFGKRELARVQV